MNLLAPSMLSIDFGHMEDELRTAINAGADYIHVELLPERVLDYVSFALAEKPVVDENAGQFAAAVVG